MDVVFAVLPFADVSRPAIGVSLLQAALRRRGIESCVEYLNLAFSEKIGLELYQLIANSFATHFMLGEWVFAADVFGGAIPNQSDFLREILPASVLDHAHLQKVLAIRRQIGTQLEVYAQRIARHQPKIVGLTTTFHQTCASLAIAHRLKQGKSPPLIVFGGANCEGEMGWQMLRSFPWIDYVSTGEADLSFAPFVEKSLAGHSVELTSGLIGRDEPLTYPERVQKMDSLPIPDYSDYFGQLRESSLVNEFQPTALIETARGCWWGAKSHCTFCGLNGSTMAFRSKSSERAFSEMKTLSETYGVKKIDAVDNILDLRYIKELFPKLAESGLELDLFYEVKANLRHDQLVSMRRGGVSMIQPGIESLSDEVLRLMKKGCTAFQNIQLLKWCAELGVKAGWNILSGFPGESPSEYDRQAAMIPLLTHLEPPASCVPVRLDRFSPFFEHAMEFGMERVRPMRAYYYVFPLGRSELMRLAYFFDFDYRDGCRPESYLANLQRAVDAWIEARQPSGTGPARLDAEIEGDAITITDTRAVASKTESRLNGLSARLLLACDSARTEKGLFQELRGEVNEGEVRHELEVLQENRLVLEQHGLFLSLPVLRHRVDSAHVH
jgi:ribosomal peptide maturation radical SAM protein 1